MNWANIRPLNRYIDKKSGKLVVVTGKVADFSNDVPIFTIGYKEIGTDGVLGNTIYTEKDYKDWE